MSPGDNAQAKRIFIVFKINLLVHAIYLMLNLVRLSFILYRTADYD